MAAIRPVTKPGAGKKETQVLIAKVGSVLLEGK